MSGDRKTPPPGLTPEERALWRKVAGDVRPLERPSRRHGPLAGGGKPAASATDASPPVKGPPPVKATKTACAPARELRHGSIADLDKRSATRLRRGQIRVEGRLDLHGYTQAAAQRELDRFLAAAQAAGKRCVLVITGKGTTTEGGGVLRAQVPRWLNQAPNRARVLAFDYAQPRHGGLGALYVLLRKARG